MKSFRLSIFTFIIILIINYCTGCNIDHGLDVDDLTEEVQHGIKGTIIFNGTWPEEIVESRLVASVTFPPDPAAPLQEFIFSDPIPLGVDTFDYSFSLEPETYRLIGFIARESGQSWNISNLLAVFSPIPGLLIPDSVVVETDTTVVEDVDIFVDFTKGSISGTVTFVGEWPSDTHFAGIAVYAQYPPLNPILFSGVAILPVQVTSTTYKVLVPPGRYEGVIVAAGSSLLEIRTIGIYYAPGDTTKPGIVDVLESKDTPGIDIEADLSLLK
ncbi:MAG: hypothetical protein ACE5NG_04480 [bacterium]